MAESRIKEIIINEKELEEFLIKHPNKIEEGIKILGHQIKTDSGPLDILAVDEDGILTVVELKAEMDDGQLDQGIRYYDWARTNIDWISRAFKEVDAEQEPRLILIAPAFSENLLKIAKYVNITLDLIEYIAIELPNGEWDIISRPREIGGPPEPAFIPTRERNLKRIEDEKVRQLV